MPTVAEQLLNETFARLIYATSVAFNFRTTLLAVSGDAEKHLNSKLTRFIRDLFEAPEWKGFLKPIDPTASASPKKPDYAELAKTGTKAMLGTTYAQVDAATLILFYSILDGVVSDCFLRQTVTVDRVGKVLASAVERSVGQPEYRIATAVRGDFPLCDATLTSRCSELPHLLETIQHSTTELSKSVPGETWLLTGCRQTFPNPVREELRQSGVRSRI